MTLQPVHKLILTTLEKAGGRATLQACIDAAPAFMPDAPPIDIDAALPAATTLRDWNCVEQLGDGLYAITDLGLASLQYGVRMSGTAH